VGAEERVPPCLDISAEAIPVSSNQRCLRKISSGRSLVEEVSISSVEVVVSEALVSSGGWSRVNGSD
jgi:hypothetical protein